jgi:hypothetical protein
MGSDEKGLAYDPGLLFATGLRNFFHCARDIRIQPSAVSRWFASAKGDVYGSAARTLLSVWKEIPTMSTATAIGRSGDNFSLDILPRLYSEHVVCSAHSP